MISFKEFTILLEAKLDDIKRGIANRHKAETGEDIDPSELHDVVTRAKKLPGVDLTKSSFGELKDKLDPGIKQIYHNRQTGVTINHVTRKDTCVKGYGHGKTNWCVSATGEGNLFNSYGKNGKRFFTVHHKNPETGQENVLGIHEHENGTIRDEKNNEVGYKVHPDVWKAMAKTPELSKINIMSKNPHAKIASEDIDKALDDKDYDVRRAAIQHPNVIPKHITKVLEDDQDARVREAAIKHPSATEEHITKALNDEDSIVRYTALRHPKATPEHITKALNDESSRVRLEAIKHPKATPDHITKALNDESSRVRLEAIKHPKATPDHITKALNDEDPIVRRAAIQHPRATPEHITKALNDESSRVRREAIKHPSATEEHITKALNDEDPIVRREAQTSKDIHDFLNAIPSQPERK